MLNMLLAVQEALAVEITTTERNLAEPLLVTIEITRGGKPIRFEGQISRD